MTDAIDRTDPLPLFPLQTVLFPGGLLMLKVFEARYLDLVSRCLRSGQGFGVVCLRQGNWPGRMKDVEEIDLEELKAMVKDDSDAAEARP